MSSGNLLTENINEEVDIEYPDGSKYSGMLKEGPNYELFVSEGTYKKKAKNNHSYYKRYLGQYEAGVPHTCE
jgi:hypothetical protein